MDFSRFNQAEQAQIAAMIEHKQVQKKWIGLFEISALNYTIDL